MWLSTNESGYGRLKEAYNNILALVLFPSIDHLGGGSRSKHPIVGLTGPVGSEKRRPQVGQWATCGNVCGKSTLHLVFFPSYICANT